MPSLHRPVRRHLGISIPLFLFYAGAVMLASRGDVDGRTLAVIGIVLVLTLLTPAAVGAMNRRYLRGSWTPHLAAGEQVLYDGAADRYQAGHFGWLFLTDQRLLFCRVGGGEQWSVPLSRVDEASVGRYAGVLATDLRLRFADGTGETLKVEGAGEWVRQIRAAVQERVPEAAVLPGEH